MSRNPPGMDGAVIVLGAAEIEALLADHEPEIRESVAAAYVAHGRGESSLPHSSFLRFPKDDLNRIIALPAYLGDGFGTAGLKWIASFPGNVASRLPRASAVLILNSLETGRPFAILEGSIISARRTAASAALAAEVLAARPPEVAGIVGAGLINFELARQLRSVFPGLGRFLVFDLDRGRAEAFGERVRQRLAPVAVEVAGDLESVLVRAPVVSFATTAVEPHVRDLAACPPGATILHVSLRDLAPEAILAADNVVDDPDHVCRARTSVHLAAELSGERSFIRCTLAELLEGTAPAKADPDRVTVFSPFGLGILDLAVGKLALDSARERGLGTVLDSFLPAP